MTDDGAAIRTAFEAADAFEVENTNESDGVDEDGATAANGETTASVTTTAFEATVTARPADGVGVAFTVVVAMPTLRAAVRGEEVGPSLHEGWHETLERRLEDAPSATRARVDLDAFDVSADGDRVDVTYEYTFGGPERGVGVAKTFVEYVEGTYVQGVVPGFEYDPPVSDLLSDAGQSDGGPGGTPL